VFDKIPDEIHFVVFRKAVERSDVFGIFPLERIQNIPVKYITFIAISGENLQQYCVNPRC
jgi:hypothetical protein